MEWVKMDNEIWCNGIWMKWIMKWNGSQLMKWGRVWKVAYNSWCVLFNCRKTSNLKIWNWNEVDEVWNEMNEIWNEVKYEWMKWYGVWMNEWNGIWMDEMRWTISEMDLHLWFCNSCLQKQNGKVRVSEKFWFSPYLFCIKMPISDWFSCLYFYFLFYYYY